MKRVFEFVSGLGESFFEFYGYPTIKFFSDYVEVYFDCRGIVKDLSLFSKLSVSVDGFRMFACENVITFVFTFYLDD